MSSSPAPLLDRLFRAIDARDTDQFVSFLTEDGEFRFGNAPVVKGRAAVADAVNGFFATIDGLSHSVTRVWRDGDTLACEGEVSYRRHDGADVVLPFVDTFEFVDSLISSYRIYIDIAPLYAE